MKDKISVASKLLLTTSIILNIVACNTFPQPQNTSSEPKTCEDAIASATSQLQQGDRPLVIETSQTSDANFYEGYPQNRPDKYSFLLSNTDAGFSIMNADALLNSVATEVTNNCSSVSLVEFSVDKTHYAIDYGIMPNGNVIKFECPEGFDVSTYTKSPQWGETCRA